MASLFSEFKRAQSSGSGAALAETITPIAPAHDPNRLRSFYNSTNSASVQSDIRYSLLKDRSTGTKLPKQEGQAWVDIFVAFWKAAGEITRLQENPHPSLNSDGGSYVALFNLWKEVANLLIRGYSNAGFEAWTLPCLYVVGRYLRVFAIKADEETAQNPTTANEGFQDDMVVDFGKNAKLEETSRIINRMFTLCLHDR